MASKMSILSIKFPQELKTKILIPLFKLNQECTNRTMIQDKEDKVIPSNLMLMILFMLKMYYKVKLKRISEETPENKIND